MTLKELLAQFRVDSTDSVGPEYLFSDQSVKTWLNEAQDEAAMRASLLQESSNPSVCRIAVTAGKSEYKLHKAVLDITRAAFTPTGGSEQVLGLTDIYEMDRTVPDWRTTTADPLHLIQNDTKIRLGFTPANAGILSIECNRLPINPMEDDDDEPEIASVHHRQLVHWVLYRAFSVPDSETIDPNRAALSEREFTKYFGLRPDANTRKSFQSNRPAHNKAW